MKTTTALILFCLSISFGYAQYDWTYGELLLKNGETLFGQIELPTVSKNLLNSEGNEKVRFRRDRKAKKIKFDASEVDEIIFRQGDSQVAHFKYVPISDNKEAIFQVISRGPVSLYARRVSVSTTSPNYRSKEDEDIIPYWNYSYNETDEYYVKRRSEYNATPLITAAVLSSFKNKAMKYFADCPSLVYKLDKKILVKNDIKTVVDEYNDCL
jgi:hypothetical protein